VNQYFSFSNYRMPIILLLSSSLIVWIYLLLKKYQLFGYFDWDLAILSQAVWQLSHGSQSLSLTGFNFFGDHANFIALFMIPVYKIFPHPLTLVVIKIILFHIAALSLYYITQKYLNKTVAVIFVIAFLFFPPNIFANIYEFNFDCVALVLLFWMIYFYKEKKFVPFLAVSCFVLLVKENMSLLLAMFGVLTLFLRDRDRWKWGVVPIIIGGALFFVLTMYVIPGFRGSDSYVLTTRYRHLGGSVGEILRAVFFNPGKILSMIFHFPHIYYFVSFFGGFLALSLLGGEVLLISTPFFLQHLLSSNWQEHTIFYHYSHALVPFIFLSAVYGLARVKHKWGERKMMVVVTILGLIQIGHFAYFFNEYKSRLGYQNPRRAQENWQLVNAIPNDGHVLATFDYLAPLSARTYLYSFHKVFDEQFQNEQERIKSPFYTKQTFAIPENVEYALIDLHDRWLMARKKEAPESVEQRIKDFLTSEEWTVILKTGSRVLLQRNQDFYPRR